MRAELEAFRKRPLRAHDVLADVPLHDVWTCELPGGPPGLALRDLPDFLPAAGDTHPPGLPTRALFALRVALGRVFGWDRAGAPAPEPFPLPAEDRARSLVAPGSPGPGPFRWVYEHDEESLLEVRNATVHAFLSQSLERREGGYRVWIAIYVRPVHRLSRLYLAAIAPARHFIVYPALLRRMRRAWDRSWGAPYRDPGP